MVRLRRLQADFERLKDYVNRHPRLQLIQAEGSPPERYQIEYKIRSLRQKDGQMTEVTSHLVEIALPRDYPRVPPLCRMLTPVFHPNIAPHAICIGDHWSAGEALPALVARIGEILAYQSYNTKSPLNGEAARWVDQNVDRLPLDNVSMVVDGGPAPATPATTGAPMPQRAAMSSHAASAASTAVAPPPPQPAPVAAPAVIEFACPTCGSRLRLRQRPTTSRLRCPQCQTIFEAPAI
jgi:ubiquitin-protein ligase